MNSTKRQPVALMLTAMALGLGACSSLTRNEQAAAVGAVVGGVVGSKLEKKEKGR